MVYYAHSTEQRDKSDWQLLEEHLDKVAELAQNFASQFDAGEWGRLAGLFHDAGKATKAFTQRLEGSTRRVDHASYGARLAKEKAGKLGLLLSYVICGHHGGLPDGGLQEGQLHFRLRNANIADDTVLLPEADVAAELRPPFLLEPQWAGYSLAFFTRMVFSCLVDADFLDTERFCTPERNAWREFGSNVQFSELMDKLKSFINKKEQNAKPSNVNIIRKDIVRQCRDKAATEQGFFSLTVPTGGGKTLSSLSFALHHATQHNLSRVIYAIPFTSIIEQNAKVFREAIGRENVLEHHSNYFETERESNYDKWRGLAAENWDAPIVVTTNVQFFESFYSNKTSRCRKLHNVANSVIILDEAQAIPTEYLEPCLAVLRELVEHYSCTVLLCTATQPVLDDLFLIRKALPRVQEIIEQPQSLFAELKRVQVEFIGNASNQELARKIDSHPQTLCIVSTKKQAQQVYAAILNKEGAFHLSTNMYPVHRLKTLDTIRKSLEEGKPCRVIATSLVEAGVDLDFPIVYRAMAGLDSIAQAAGRCNREGNMEFGQVYVYEPEEISAMPWLQRRISRARETLRTLPDEDPLALRSIRKFFKLLFDVEELDKKLIVERLNPKLNPELVLPFKDIANDFRLIEDEGVGLIIPCTDEVNKLVEQLRYTKFYRTTVRRLQRYTVNIRKTTLERLVNSGVVEIIGEYYPVLSNMQAYDNELGFVEEMAEIWEPENFIV